MSNQQKGIEFKINLNTQEANKQIADLQQKLQSMSKTSGYADRARAVFGDNSQMSRESQKIFKDQQTADSKYLKDKFDSLQRNKELADKMLTRSLEGGKQTARDLEKQIQLQEKLFNIQKQQVDIAEKMKTSGAGNLPQGFGGGISAGGSGGGSGTALPQGFGGAGMGGQPSGGSGGGFFGEFIASSVGRMMTAGAIVGMITKVAQGTVAEVANTFSFNQNQTRSQASVVGATRSASGINDIASGRGAGTSMWNPARMKAKLEAEEAYKGQRIGEGVFEAGGTAAGYLAGGETTAEYGAGIGGLMRGGTEATAGMRGRLSSLFSTGSFKGGAEASAKARALYKEQQIAADAATNVEAEKGKDPLRDMATNYFESNRGRMLQAQQMSGMGDQEMANMLKGGGLYTEDQKYGMMQGIAGAGGSSAQMRAGRQGLDLQRGYGIQNAAGVMGMLSSGLGGGQTAGDATTKRILADAFSIGLDASHFSRETEKFLLQSAQFISDSGARTVAEQQAAMNISTVKGTGTSMQEIAAMGSGRSMGLAAQGAGASPMAQAMQLSSMRTDKFLGKLQDTDRQYLMELDPSQINESDPQIAGMMSKTGSTIEQLRSGVMKAKSIGSGFTSQQVREQSRLGELSKKYGYGAMNNQAVWAQRLASAGTEEEKNDIKKDMKEQAELFSSVATTLKQQVPSLSGAIGTKLTAGVEQFLAPSQYEEKQKYMTQGLGAVYGMGQPSEMPGQEEGLATRAQKAEAAGEQALAGTFLDKYSEAYEQSSQNMLSHAQAFVDAMAKATVAAGGVIPMSKAEKQVASAQASQIADMLNMDVNRQQDFSMIQPPKK